MKYLCAMALAGLATAAPIIGTLEAKLRSEMLTKRQGM